MLPLLAACLLATAPSPRSRAQALARRSIIEYNAGDFERALADAQQAYETEPLPALLYNLGQCHRALHHWERALFFYQGYLREKPQAANRAAVQALIAEMAKKQQADEARQAAPPPTLIVPASPPPGPTASPTIASSPARRALSAPEVPTAAVSAPEPQRRVPAAAWWLIGTGAGAGAAGGILLGLGSIDRQPAAGHPATYASLTQSNTLTLAADVALGVGGALLVGGLAVALFGGSSTQPPQAP